MMESIQLSDEHVTEAQNAVVLSQAAATKVAALIQEADMPGLALRAYVTGGGCAGFQYGFSFAEAPESDDWHYTGIADSGASVTLLVDPMSHPYLVGATIDYQVDVQGERFVIKNASWTGTCSCGSSFAVADG